MLFGTKHNGNPFVYFFATDFCLCAPWLTEKHPPVYPFWRNKAPIAQFFHAKIACIFQFAKTESWLGLPTKKTFIGERKMKQTKKGFTLVELLVVIAILAILATVSVVGYTTFIEKANRSVDEQAVAQINTALMAANIPEGSITNIAQVQELLDECNLEIEDYKPLSKDKFFFYDSKLNRVIYTNNTDYQVLYPQELADKTDRANWFSLSGVISKVTTDTTWLDDSAQVIATITTAEQLFTLSEDFNKYSDKEIVINIENDLNMMGAALSFSTDRLDNIKISGPANGATIYNIANTSAATEASKDNSDRVPRNYGGGLFADVNTGDIVVIENITISNAQIGGAKIGNVGAFIGAVRSQASLTLTNCHVIDSVITGQKKVGGLIGMIQQAGSPAPLKELNITNCSVEGTTIQVLEGECGTVAGYVQHGTNAQCALLDAVTVTNSSVVYIGTNKTTDVPSELAGKVTGQDFFGAKTDSDGYRPFASNAKYCLYVGGKYSFK